jgi:LmbE family N-acetylglucosaminyl deacetylase
VPRSLLAVHAHPDDETITTGGTLARSAAQGVRTIVVTCTRGDLGENLSGEAGEVGALRDRELRAALATLGVSRHVYLPYLDSGMAGEIWNHRPGAFWAAPIDEAVQHLLAVIRDERPQVMLAYDETGGYGHPDHVRAHQVALAAFEAAGDARPSKLYLVRIPLGWSREFVRSLRQAGIDAPASAACGADAGPAVLEVGTPDDLVTTEVDVSAYVDTKYAALACHRSQMPPTHFLMRMTPALRARLWAREFFSRVTGPTAAPAGARETDLFSGLD